MIPYGKHHVDEEDIQAVADLLRTGWLTQGPMVGAFEDAVKEYVGAKYAVAVSSGTAALHIAALAAEVGPGDGLITSPITFVASANAAIYSGATPIFCDIDPETVNVSASGLQQVVDAHPEARAVIPVHYSGLPCEMEAIAKVAKKSGLRVIEDAAHALGSTYDDGSRVGSCKYSDMTMFSFHPVKAIAAGEGGMITTNDAELYKRLLRLRSHGINKGDDPFQILEQAEANGERNPWYYEMQQIGFNYRITDIQCALALSQFKKIDRFVARRKKLAKAYDVAFQEFENAKPAQAMKRDQSGHHLYVLRVDFGAIGMSRAQLMLALRDRGVGTQVHYVPVPAHPFYRDRGYKLEDFPHAEKFYEEALTIPLFYDLTDEQQHFIVTTFAELVG
ncbi:MAG: UDP-4-amino-4,6-dideoxy-N-acetyl-beta-L-altrosamine transaminase [Rhodobacteraceae bacterium]|nr:UDP-4-amino-4,6-dideoxy-N-acetyl-beta-L-altrosamine transaminase [Paracoccaceae bacterium]